MEHVRSLPDGTVLAGKLSAAEVQSFIQSGKVASWLFLNPPSTPDAPMDACTAAKIPCKVVVVTPDGELLSYYCYIYS